MTWALTTTVASRYLERSVQVFGNVAFKYLERRDQVFTVVG